MPRLSHRYQAILRAYVESPRINAIPIEAEALYIRLVCLSDGDGRYYRDAFTVAARALTDRFKGGLTVSSVEHWLCTLENEGLIESYEAGGERYLTIHRYFAAGRKVRTEFPGPPRPPLSPDVPQVGTTSSPQVTNISDSSLTRPLPGPSGLDLDRSMSMNNNMNSSMIMSTQLSSESSGGSPEDAASSGTKDGMIDMARELVVRELFPLGFDMNATPEAVEILCGPQWLGSNLTDSTIADALRAVAFRCRGKKNPPGLALTILRSEGAQQALAAKKELPDGS